MIIRHVGITNRVGEFTRKKGATMGIPLYKNSPQNPQNPGDL
jgi:hypothetical protein